MFLLFTPDVQVSCRLSLCVSLLLSFVWIYQLCLRKELSLFKKETWRIPLWHPPPEEPLLKHEQYRIKDSFCKGTKNILQNDILTHFTPAYFLLSVPWTYATRSEWNNINKFSRMIEFMFKSVYRQNPEERAQTSPLAISAQSLSLNNFQAIGK